MAVSVRRWTQRRLLYPLAVFAIIAPTVIMGLFGTYALREIELRPSSHRAELQAVRQSVEIGLETRMRALAITPPAGPADVDRAREAVERYFLDYTRSIAGKAYIGSGGRVEAGLAVDGTRGHQAPAVLLEALANIKTGPERPLTREQLSVETFHDGELRHRSFVVFASPSGFIAWELLSTELDRQIRQDLAEMDLKNDALSVELVGRGDFDWTPRQRDKFEVLGFVPAHDTLLADRYLVLKVNTQQQFYKDETLLSTIFIVIAVLCVPIVASATLMVVHMILREASEARKKVDFVSNVTHELKTPLTSIRMFVETLKLGRVKDPAKVQACLDTIMSETQRLGALIDHVLSFSKVENQVKKYNIASNDLVQVVVDTINFFKGQAPKLRDRVQKQIRPGVPSAAEFDKDAMREVLLNLLSNAVKYSPNEKPIFVTVGAGDRELFIAVQDQGIGIGPEHHERIFDKFFRVDEDLTRNVDGTGLGLAIVAEIVKAHGGRITVDSQIGRGSTFTVYLPWVHGRAPVKRKTTRSISGAQPAVAAEPAAQAETREQPKSDPAARTANIPLLGWLAGAALLLPAASLALAQPDPRPEGEEAEKPRKESSLLARPDSDNAAEAWVKKLGGLRPQAVAVEPGVILNHVLAPEGDRLYYFRPARPTPPATRATGRFALYSVGPAHSEARVLDTGASCDPPLFLADGRILTTQRRVDTNDDGEVNLLDQPSLVICSRTGENPRTVAVLAAGTVPVALWRGDTEVLVSVPGADDPNGWILSVNLVKGTSDKVVQAFNVALVLDDDKLLIERLVAPSKAPQQPRWNRFGEIEPEENEGETRTPQLSDPPEHLVFNPADGSLVSLHSSTSFSRIVCTGEGAYFGHQLSRSPDTRPRPGQQGAIVSEILIVDDSQHRDTRSNSARYDHFALCWIKERGLLCLQTANLRSKLLLLDRSLKWHTLGELDLAVRGVRAAGTRLCWLEVEDTDNNGVLEPWKDNSRPFFCTIE
ncbi:MAG: hypothetical protein KF754_06480 [Planctomycetes bacterium]|nr:hypothetical protein [Planctomycetota bacterium]